MRQVLLFLLEIEGCRIHAKARPGGPWAIGKNVSQVRIALSTKRFHAPHAVARVGFRSHFSRIQRLRETGPTSARLKLGSAIEQFGATACAAVRAVFVVIPVLARESRFRALLASHVILLRSQLFAPLLIGFLYFFHGTSSLPDSAYTGI